MNFTNPKLLYSVDPNFERFSRWFREASATAIRVYWELFVSLPIAVISIVLAVIVFGVSVMDIVQHPSRFLFDILPISTSIVFIIFHRVRAFFWVLLGCLIPWLVVVVGLLLPIVGADFRVVTTPAKILLTTAYFLPPVIAALYIDYARHRDA